MAYDQPGVRVRQQNVETPTTTVEAELPTLIVGPLYEVFENEQASGTFDPLTAGAQSFTWPELRVGTVVDLEGTRNGLIDSQRRDLAPYVPTFYLVDGTTKVTVSDSYVESLTQSGFDLNIASLTGLERDTLNFYAITLNGSEILYQPDGGLANADVGDRLTVGATATTIATVSDTKITVEENISTEAQAPVRVDEDEAGPDTVVIAPSPTAGRVTVTLTGTDFVTENPSIAVGDAVVTGVPMTGLTSISGAITDGDASYDDINGLTFGVDVSLSDVDDYIVRVVNSTVPGGQTYFTNVVAIDTTAGTMTVGSAVGTADADVVSVTIYEAQTGYIESISTDNLELTAVVPNTFADTGSFIDIYSTELSNPVYPEFNVEVDYRASRKELTDQVWSAASPDELLELLDIDAVNYKDGLAFAVNVALLAQPSDAEIFFIPVDPEPDTSTGLPENFDLTTGYQNALEAAESVDVYSIVPLDRSTAIDSALQVHVDTMSTEVERAWRRGFFITDVPLGETQSEQGVIQPGFVPGGVANNPTDGNKIITDPNVDFVTTAGVVAGTSVVVTYPEEYAGEYTADGATTNDALILSGAGWEITREFAISGTFDVDTIAADTHVISGGTITATQFVHVEPGDYIEFDEGATTYRLRVTAATANTITATDEVPGALSFTGTGSNGSNGSVIRSWGPSNGGGVEYYIKPLTKSQQITELVDSKTLADRRYTLLINQQPTLQIGTDSSGDPITDQLDAALTAVAIAAKRSGLSSYQDVTNLTLEGGISATTYGYNYFKRSQLNALAEVGYTLCVQKTASAEPYIRDMVTTSGLTAGLVEFEEMVTANVDWISKTLRDTFAPPVGSRLPNINKRLLGIRHLQIDAILASWKEDERLVDYTINKVVQNSINKRQVDIDVLLVVPVAEKEIEITLQVTV